MDKIVGYAGTLGLRIILDNHRITAGHGAEKSGLRHSARFPEDQWVADLQAVAKRYRGMPAVIGIDLFDELHAAARLAVIQRRFDDANAFLAPSLLRNPDDVDALCLPALAHWRSHGDFAAAESHLARAQALRPHDPSVLTLRAEFALHLGDVGAVFALAERALAADETKSAALITMARADARRVDDAMLERMYQLTQAATTKNSDLRHLHNAIGRVLDMRADYDAAFDHFTQSNHLASGVYDPSVEDKRLTEVRRVFTRPFFDARHGYGLRGHGGIFIVGPPRTGSTLIEQMLKAHPGIESCGESGVSGTLIRASVGCTKALPITLTPLSISKPSGPH
jgi:tetratricopeptide (TPR) repeat protein